MWARLGLCRAPSEPRASRCFPNSAFWALITSTPPTSTGGFESSLDRLGAFKLRTGGGGMHSWLQTLRSETELRLAGPSDCHYGGRNFADWGPVLRNCERARASAGAGGGHFPASPAVRRGVRIQRGDCRPAGHSSQRGEWRCAYPFRGRAHGLPGASLVRTRGRKHGPARLCQCRDGDAVSNARTQGRRGNFRSKSLGGKDDDEHDRSSTRVRRYFSSPGFRFKNSS